MNIAIIRGPFLNKFEMQNYEPIARYHSITAYCTSKNYFNVGIINLKKKKLKSLECLFGYHASKLLKLPLHVAGYYFHMIGLERELKLMDIAHAVETYSAFSYQAIKAKERYGVKVVITQWENIPYNHENLIACRYIKNKVKKETDLFIAVTEQAKNALMREGIPEERISVIPVGVDLDRFKPSRKNGTYLRELDLSHDDFIILFVGRLVKEKGIYDLISAYRKLLRDQKIDKNKIKLVVVGKGPAEKDIVQLSKHRRDYAYTEMHRLHNLADVFVLPSVPTEHWQEQFGMALVEAMACEKPVVSTVSGSIPEVVGKAGMLISPNDPLGLYEALKKLILDRSEGAELGKLARRRVEQRYDARRIAIKLRNVYEKL